MDKTKYLLKNSKHDWSQTVHESKIMDASPDILMLEMNNSFVLETTSILSQNLTWMVIAKLVFLRWTGNPRWLPLRALVFKLGVYDKINKSVFLFLVEIIEAKLYINGYCVVTYKVGSFYLDQKSKILATIWQIQLKIYGGKYLIKLYRILSETTKPFDSKLGCNDPWIVLY